MAKVTELVAALAAPIAEQNGCTLWDVEYVREAGTWYLRVFLDAPEGVSIDQCEAVSRPLSDALDEVDPDVYKRQAMTCGFLYGRGQLADGGQDMVLAKRA